jgi:hypothetical protein
MEDGSGGGEGSTSARRFPILQASRDPESNWEVDVAKSLEEYLLKICSGEISGQDGAYNFNFAEGALMCGVSCGQLVDRFFFYGLCNLPGFVSLEIGRAESSIFFWLVCLEVEIYGAV